jgi:hypothetical protein
MKHRPYDPGLIELEVVPKEVRCYDPLKASWGKAEPSALPLPGPQLFCENAGYAYHDHEGCSVGPTPNDDAPNFLDSQILTFLPDGVLIDGARDADLMVDAFDGGFGVFTQDGGRRVSDAERAALFRRSAGVPGALHDGALILERDGRTHWRSDPRVSYPSLRKPEDANLWWALLPSPDGRFIAAVGQSPGFALLIYEVAP